MSVADLTPTLEGGVFPVLSKTFVRDLVPDLKSGNGFVLEKVEGLAMLANRDAIIVTDNGGVDDTSGETQFLNLGELFAINDDDD